jgi:hypothetical protein
MPIDIGVTQMSKDIIGSASAINLAEIQAHPVEALAALVKLVQIQGEEIEHLRENQEIQATQIFKLREQITPRPQPAQKDHGTVLRALIADHGGKMLAKEARQIMRMTPSRFSELLRVTEGIEAKEFSMDKRKSILSLKN